MFLHLYNLGSRHDRELGLIVLTPVKGYYPLECEFETGDYCSTLTPSTGGKKSEYLVL